MRASRTKAGVFWARRITECPGKDSVLDRAIIAESCYGQICKWSVLGTTIQPVARGKALLNGSHANEIANSDSSWMSCGLGERGGRAINLYILNARP